MRLLVGIVAGLVSGCALLPDDAVIEAVHESHLTQHPPFASEQGEDNGSNTLALALKWKRGPWVIESSEGYSFHGRDGCPTCPRERFTATVGYDIPLRRTE